MSSARSLRSSKRQTRLAFQPLSSSSPTKSEYSPAIQNRLANVRFNVAGTLRQSTTFKGTADKRMTALPSPQPSSQIQKSTNSDEPKSLSPPRATSPLTSVSSSPVLPAQAKPVVVDSDTSENEEDIVLPSSKRRRVEYDSERNTNSARRSIRLATQSSPLKGKSSTALAEDKTPTRKSSRLVSQSIATPTTSEHLGAGDTQALHGTLSAIASAETSGDEDDVIVSRATTTKRTSTANRFNPFVVDDEGSDTQPIRAEVRTPRGTNKSKRSAAYDGFLVDDDDEIEYVTSEEDVKPSGSKRRLKKPSGTTHGRIRREKAELEEDLLDLQDSDHHREDDTELSRTRGGPVTTQRDKTREHFEKLKRRRAGEKELHNADLEYEGVEEEDYDAIDIENIARAPHPNIISDESGDDSDNRETYTAQCEVVEGENDDDFVVDDTGTTGRLGRPLHDIPLQFTSFASAKPRELFIHIIEWMVKNKISPAFNRDDELYNLSFSRVDDQVKAQAGSRLISSAWSATFKYAVLARPHMKVTSLPGLDEDNIRTCDACNRTNHPARYDFVFSGDAYSKTTLEPIDESDVDETETDNGRDSDTKVGYDEQGHILASESTHFYLGRFCAANAEMGHKLTHWKHRLNGQVLAYLEEQDVLSAEAIINRERLNKKKREREAENVVDMMSETGTISELWQNFQDDLEDARIGMEGHERKGGRSKARIGSVRTQPGDGRVGEWSEGGKYKHIAKIDSDSEGE